LEVRGADGHVRFRRHRTGRQAVESLARRTVARVERSMGRYSFFVFFVMAWTVAELAGRGIELTVVRFPRFGIWFFDHLLLSVPLWTDGQMAVMLYFMARRIPPWIDNAYRHESRADNLDSLRRVPADEEDEPS